MSLAQLGTLGLKVLQVRRGHLVSLEELARLVKMGQRAVRDHPETRGRMEIQDLPGLKELLASLERMALLGSQENLAFLVPLVYLDHLV